MEYIMVKLPKKVLYLTDEEIGRLILHDLDLFKLAIKRGKGITRHNAQRAREQAKFRREKGL